MDKNLNEKGEELISDIVKTKVLISSMKAEIETYKSNIESKEE